MNQQTKQVSATTGHDCASKGIEQAHLEKQVAKFLKAGGKIKVVSADPQINQKLVHGTRHSYVIAMCRCGPCTKWANKHRVTQGEVA